MLGTISSELKKGEKVQIDGFGTFEMVKRERRKGRNPKTESHAGPSPMCTSIKCRKDVEGCVHDQ